MIDRNDMWVLVLMVLAICSSLYYQAVFHYGEIYEWERELYMLCSSVYGACIGFALAGASLGRWSKYWK